MGFSGTLGESAIWPPLPTIDELVAIEEAKVDEITSIRILCGFDFVVDGKEYHFSYQATDQTNFSQMNASAAMSIQLGAMSATALNNVYPGYKDSKGNLHPELLPVALPDSWLQAWRGHADGQSYTLMLTPQTYLQLAGAGGAHNQKCLADGWKLKAQLRACKTEAELKVLVKELDLDLKLRDTRDQGLAHGVITV